MEESVGEKAQHEENGNVTKTDDVSLTEVDKYLRSFPPGYKFEPFDDELIVQYLQPKINGQHLPLNLMHDVNIYRHNPDQLTAEYSAQGQKIWYFFTSRDRKYRNGKRPNRKAGDGYWKATGADKVIKHSDIEVGFRKALVFYRGKPPKGDKTLWIMHEFRLTGPPHVTKRKTTSHEDTSMKLDDYVLCRIYKKEDGPNKNRSWAQHEGEAEEKEAGELETSSIDSVTPSPNQDYGDDVNMYSTMNIVNTSNPNPFGSPMNDFTITPVFYHNFTIPPVNNNLCYGMTGFNNNQHIQHGNTRLWSVKNDDFGIYADQHRLYLEQNYESFDEHSNVLIPLSRINTMFALPPLAQDMIDMDDTHPLSPIPPYPSQDANPDNFR